MDELAKQIKRKFSKNSLRQWLRVMHSNKMWYDSDDSESEASTVTSPIAVTIGHQDAPLPQQGRVADIDPQQSQLTRVQVKFDRAAVRSVPVFTVSPNHVIDHDAHIRAEGKSEVEQHWGWLSERPSIEDYDQMERLARGQRFAVDYDSISKGIEDQTWQWLLDD